MESDAKNSSYLLNVRCSRKDGILQYGTRLSDISPPEEALGWAGSDGVGSGKADCPQGFQGTTDAGGGVFC